MASSVDVNSAETADNSQNKVVSLRPPQPVESVTITIPLTSVVMTLDKLLSLEAAVALSLNVLGRIDSYADEELLRGVAQVLSTVSTI